jgi:hypothetical protein
VEESQSEASPGKSHKTLNGKIAKTKKAGGPWLKYRAFASKHKALSSNPSIAKREKEKRKEPHVVEHTYNPSAQEAKAGRSRVQN